MDLFRWCRRSILFICC